MAGDRVKFDKNAGKRPMTRAQKIKYCLIILKDSFIEALIYPNDTYKKPKPKKPKKKQQSSFDWDAAKEGAAWGLLLYSFGVGKKKRDPYDY